MEITGKNFIGDRLSSLGEEYYKTFDSLRNVENKTLFISANTKELEEAVTLADAAFPIYRDLSDTQRAFFFEKYW